PSSASGDWGCLQHGALFPLPGSVDSIFQPGLVAENPLISNLASLTRSEKEKELCPADRRWLTASLWEDADGAHVATDTQRVAGIAQRETISVPRADVRVSVDGFEITPFMGLTSWTAFRKGPHGVTVMGDIVLLEDEIGEAISSAVGSDLYVTALLSM